MPTDTQNSWKKVHCCEGYEVSRLGEVRNKKTGRVLKHIKVGRKRRQYPAVSLPAGPNRSFATVVIHKLVARAYLGETPPGKVICHKDDDQWNTSADNLYFGTISDNSRDMVRFMNGGHQILSEKEARDIAVRRAAGESGVSLSKEYGVSQQTICDIYRKRRVVQ